MTRDLEPIVRELLAVLKRIGRTSLLPVEAYAAITKAEAALGEPARGIPIVADPSVPTDEAHICDASGRPLGKITNSSPYRSRKGASVMADMSWIIRLWILAWLIASAGFLALALGWRPL